jgi:hypothetical protein
MWERTEGWEARLARLIERAPNVPFAWGTRDCCLWAADGVEALTARDPAASWRGGYDNEEGALRTLRAVLGADVHPSRYIEAMAERIASEIGATESTEAFARRGDIALLDGPLGRALAVIDLNGRYIVGVTQGGVARVPLAAGLRHWSVG